MNEREFNAAMSAILESVGPEVYNAIIDEANNNLDTIDDLTIDEAVALAAVTLSDDGVISEAAYGTVDAVMEAYENQMVLENLAGALDEDTYETIVNVTGQVMQECGCDISEALDVVLDEAGIILDEGHSARKKKRQANTPQRNSPAQPINTSSNTSDGVDYDALLDGNERAPYTTPRSDTSSGSDSVPQNPGTSTAQAAAKRKFSLKGAGRAALSGVKNAGGQVAKTFTGGHGRLAQVGAIGGATAVVGGGGYLAARHIMKKRKERKEAEARAAAEARKPMNRLKAAVTGKGKKAANEAATNAMAYLMECSGIGE